MQLNTSGNLGLGVTPSAWGGEPALELRQSAALFGFSGTTNLLQNAYYNGSSWIYKNSAGATLYQAGRDAHRWFTAPSGTAGNAISFTQAMTLDSSGNLLVGTTATYGNERLSVTKDISNDLVRFYNTSASSPYGVLCYFTGSAPNNTTNYFYQCVDNVATRLTLRSNGGIANYQANDVNLSDRREKTNFAPAKNYLDVICSIPVQTFNYIDQNTEEDDGLTLGVVAQDVQAVAPELVMESNWGTKDEPKMRLSIYQTDLQYALMKALQELKAEFDAYKLTHP